MSVAELGLSTALRERATPVLGLAGERLIPRGHSARILDGLLGMLLIYRIAVPGIPLPIPQLAAAALIAVALFRRPTRSFAEAWWYSVTMPLLLGFLVAETYFNGLDPLRRAGGFAILIVFAGLLASGRIDVGSVVKGLGAALVLNTIAFYAGLAPDSYGGVLTGFLQDKNAAALIYAVGTILLSMATTRVWLRVLLLLFGAANVVLTDSRTTMAAFGVAVVYLLVSTWLQRGFQLLALLGGVLVFLWADDNLTKIGQYALERQGSDALRTRIDFASSHKAAGAPWYGLGLGESTVDLEGNTWFFHNSYEALLVEGGIVLLVVTVAVYAVVGLGLSGQGFVDVARWDARVVTAATLVVFLCALRLGEVFYAPIGFVVLGVGLARLLPPVGDGPYWWEVRRG